MADNPKPDEAPHPTGPPPDPPQPADKPAKGFPMGITPREIADREKERQRREHDTHGPARDDL